MSDSKSGSSKNGISIRTRIIAALIAFAVVPLVVLIGALSLQIDVFKQAQLDRFKSMAVQVSDLIDRNLFERYGDVQAFGYNAIALDRMNWANPSPENRLVEAMDRYMANYGIYKLMILVSPAGEMHDRFRRKPPARRTGHRRRRSDRRQRVTALRPEQVGEPSAVGVSGGVDPRVVDRTLPPESVQHRVEELQIAVPLFAGAVLPAGFTSLRIREPTRRVQPLRVHDHRLRPMRMDAERPRRIARRASVAVKDEHQRGRLPDAGGKIPQRFAPHTVHHPLRRHGFRGRSRDGHQRARKNDPHQAPAHSSEDDRGKHRETFPSLYPTCKTAQAGRDIRHLPHAMSPRFLARDSSKRPHVTHPEFRVTPRSPAHATVRIDDRMTTESAAPAFAIQTRILVLRGQRVLLDRDLASLYGVPTKRLNEQVRRNSGRFPADFCFQLSPGEVANLRTQSATSSQGHGGKRHLPFAFWHTAHSWQRKYYGRQRRLR